MSTIHSRSCLSVLLMLSALPAQAQTSAADATAAQAAIHDFLDRMIGLPAVSAALTPTVTAEGDHLRLELGWSKLGSADSFSLGAGAITANAKPLSGGRWVLDDLRYPSPLEGSSGTVAGGDTAKPVTLGFALTIGTQKSSMIFDPSWTTTSTADGVLHDYSLRTETPQGTQIYRVDTLDAHSVWQPSGAGHLDMRGDSTQSGLSLTIPTPGGTPVAVTVDRLVTKGQIKNFAMQDLGDLIRDVALSMRQPDGANPASPAAKALAGRALVVLGGLIDSVDGEYTATGIKVQALANNVGIRTFGIGMHFGSEDGALQASLPLRIEGVDAPDLVKGPLGEVVPRKISITPTVSGVAKSAIVELLQQGVDGKIVGDAAWQAAFMQLLQDNPVTLGFEGLTIDFGVARLDGDGELEVSSATDMTGKAEFRATGLDALIKRANATPELKQAAPVLIFLKGMGEADGKETVWRVGYADGHFTVNDTELGDMMPGAKVKK